MIVFTYVDGNKKITDMSTNPLIVNGLDFDVEWLYKYAMMCNMQTIICPHCKKSFELSQALDSEYKEKLVEEFEKKHKDDFEKERVALEEKTAKRVKEELELTLKQKELENETSEKRNKELQEQLLSYMKANNELKEKDKDREVELQKKLSEESEKIKARAQEEAAKQTHAKLAEKDKQLQDAQKELEDAKRKLTQGSQQTQGETFELEFEELLQRQYPNDKISPVGKGVKGGDIIQEVWDRNGTYIGKILWELKNTKLWSEPWVDKLKTDKRAIIADEAILISDVLPTDIKAAGYRRGVWVTQQAFVLPLADTMRATLIQIYQAKKASEGKDTKMEILYRYLSGTEFKNRIEAIIEAFSSMQIEIEKEKRYFSNKWARDEKNIRQVIDSTYGMHGDLKGIIGGVLPQIQGLAELESGE